MGDAFGLGDGSTDLSGTPGLAEAKVAESTGTGRHRPSDGAWPRNSTLLRLLLVLAAAILVLGWILTMANGPT